VIRLKSCCRRKPSASTSLGWQAAKDTRPWHATNFDL
jgi:hypothetical protein